MELDPNIKFVGNESEPWVSNGATHHSRERGDSDPKEAEPRGRRDTMRDELIREGIVTINRGSTSINPEQITGRCDHPPDTPSGLIKEMQRYGIDDSLV